MERIQGCFLKSPLLGGCSCRSCQDGDAGSCHTVSPEIAASRPRAAGWSSPPHPELGAGCKVGVRFAFQPLWWVFHTHFPFFYSDLSIHFLSVLLVPPICCCQHPQTQPFFQAPGDSSEWSFSTQNIQHGLCSSCSTSLDVHVLGFLNSVVLF